MAPLPIFSPIDLSEITDCTLKFYFLQQAPVAAEDVSPLETVILESINHLHAAGGPYRLNLPATLRHMAQFVPPAYQDDVRFNTTARHIVATYHRRLKGEWAKVMASHEYMQLNVRLRGAVIQTEAIIDRVDREEDGGITAVKFIASPQPIPSLNLETDIETTIIHALAAAAYPYKRPVRVKRLWLYHDQDVVVQLTEKQYRRNLERMKERVQAWQIGEILARPGSYCDACRFMDQGCPIYHSALGPDNVASDAASDIVSAETTSEATDLKSNLPAASSPATLSPRHDQLMEGENFAETETDP